MKIGILGGTFNPPHLGHLALAGHILSELKLDKVFFIPTNIPPHKDQEDIEASHRLHMVELAIKGNDKFELLDIEIKRGGKSYTVDTLEQLKKDYIEDELYLIVGSDMANTFSTWRNFDRIKELAEIVVVPRPQYCLESKAGYTIVDMHEVNISSSDIREGIDRDLSIQYFIKDNVLEYMRRNDLYKKGDSDD